MSKKIALTQGVVAIVDDADYEWLMQWKWYASTWRGRPCYAVRSTPRPNQSKIWMHREILKPPSGLQVDHINGDHFDNRRCNLRLATPRQNQYNTGLRSHNSSGYKGVHRSGDKWIANININGKQTYLGRFKAKEDAAKAYAQAAKEVHGEFARELIKEASNAS